MLRERNKKKEILLIKMANYELAHWIAKQRKKKFTDKQIKDYLTQYGYSEDVISRELNFIDNQGPKNISMGTPPPAGGMRIGEDHFDTYAIISFVCLFFFPLLSFPLGIISLKHLKHDSHLKGKPLAIIAVIFGCLSLLILLSYIVFIIYAVSVSP